MRHNKKGKKLGRDAAHRDALMMNMAGALIRHGRITTTLTKAKVLRPYVEKLVTQARTDTVHSRRVVARKLHMADRAGAKRNGELPILKTLFDDVAPRFATRPGGYTRIMKLGPRPGDAAPMAILEFIDYVPEPKRASAHAAHAHAHDNEHAGHAHA
ncbi:MAG: 50S ribosomal protein L17 [Thermoleophilia bacterium]|nr:50S ribosomal protein L17 [Thermoleophilia bacterium]